MLRLICFFLSFKDKYFAKKKLNKEPLKIPKNWPIRTYLISTNITNIFRVIILTIKPTRQKKIGKN